MATFGELTSLLPGMAFVTPTLNSFQASPELLAAQIQQESGGNPNAISPKGAFGLAQLMPATSRDPGFGVAPLQNDTPEENKRLGRDYLNAMLNRYGGDQEAALVAYNWGPENADKWVRGGKKPNALPAETRDYVSKILGGISGTSPVEASAAKMPWEMNWSDATPSSPKPWEMSWGSRSGVETNIPPGASAPLSGWTPAQVAELNSRQPQSPETVTQAAVRGATESLAPDAPLGSFPQLGLSPGISGGPISAPLDLAMRIGAVPFTAGPAAIGAQFGDQNNGNSERIERNARQLLDVAGIVSGMEPSPAAFAPKEAIAPEAQAGVSVPDKTALKGAAKANYSDVTNASHLDFDQNGNLIQVGETIPGDAFRPMVTQVSRALLRARMNPKRDTRAASYLEDFSDLLKRPQTAEDLMTLRESLDSLKKSADASERRHGMILSDALDKFVSESGTSWGPQLQIARNQYARSMAADRIDRIMEKAGVAATSRHQMSDAAALQNEFAKIYRNDKLLRTYSNEDQQLIKEIATNKSATEKLTSFFGMFAPRGIFSATLPHALASMLGVPWLSPLLYGAGEAAKFAKERQVHRKVEQLRNSVLTNGEATEKVLMSKLSPKVFRYLRTKPQANAAIKTWLSSGGTIQASQALGAAVAKELNVPQLAARIAAELQGMVPSSAQSNQNQ